MIQTFEAFKQEHPEAAKTMELLGVSWQDYVNAWKQLYEPPRISSSDSTTPLPYFVSEATYHHTIASKEH